MRELSAEARLHIQALTVSGRAVVRIQKLALYSAFALIAAVLFGTVQVMAKVAGGEALSMGERTDIPVAETVDACRNATAIGETYIARRTSTPRPVHQYFRPRYRTATSPYGLAVATDA